MDFEALNFPVIRVLCILRKQSELGGKQKKSKREFGHLERERERQRKGKGHYFQKDCMRKTDK